LTGHGGPFSSLSLICRLWFMPIVLAKGVRLRKCPIRWHGEPFVEQYAHTCALARESLSSTVEKSKNDEASDGAI
jgi:hypothetical protein